jgi:hypothetical protein
MFRKRVENRTVVSLRCGIFIPPFMQEPSQVPHPKRQFWRMQRRGEVWSKVTALLQVKIKHPQSIALHRIDP